MKQPRYYYIESKKRKKHKVSFYDETGKRFAKFFETKGEAVMYITELRNQNSLPAELSFTIKERIIFSQIKFLCNEMKVSLEKAFEVLKMNLKKEEDIIISFDEALKEYILFAQKKNVRPDTLRGYITQLSLFKRRENLENVKYTTEQANKYLASISSPTHAQGAIRPFFEFCLSKKWVNNNPFKEATIEKKLKEKDMADVITPEECVNMFKTCPAQWQPTLALMCFVGIRPQEILCTGSKNVLKVCNIDFENKKIVIPANVAKTRKTRILNNLPDNLWEWLKPLQNTNPVNNVAFGSYDAFKGVKRRNISIPLKKDVLRHSFGSYAYHYLGAEHTIEIMGHEKDFSMLADHYKGIATKKDAIEYFSITPQKIA